MVFCSHSMYHIQQLCDIAIWIDKGHIREIGDSAEIVGHYEDYCNNKKAYNSIIEDVPEPGETDTDEVEPTTDGEEKKQRDCRILSISVMSETGEEITAIPPLSDITLQMEVEILKDNVEGNWGFAFMRSADDVLSSWLTTDIEGVQKGPFKRGDRFEVSLVVKNFAMRSGQFFALGGVADRSGLLWYETKFSQPLKVAANKGVGPYAMDSAWQIRQLGN